MASEGTTKYYSSIQEKMVAMLLGWEVVSGSGAAACTPGDVIDEDWLGECKTHTSPGKKIVFYQSVWKKICDEAMVKHRNPVLIVDDGSQTPSRTWCLCRLSAVSGVSSAFMDYSIGRNKNISAKADDLNKKSVEGIITTEWCGEPILICKLIKFVDVLKG